MSDRVRVILATKFPAQYIRDTIEPGLRALGVDVLSTVETSWKGTIRDVDAIAFMFQMCSHADYDAFKQRAKVASVPFVLLSRRMPEWRSAFQLAGVRLPRGLEQSAPPSVLSRAELPQPRPARALPRTFGAALRAARNEEDVTQDFIADLCGVSASLVGAWEADKQPLAPDCYDKLTEIFPELETAPAPEMTRRRSHRGPMVAADPEPRSPPVAPAVPILAPSKPINGHAVVSPLVGLLRAARALGITGDVVVVVTDDGVRVQVGSETWTGASDADAIAQARAALNDRLTAQLARLNEARALLASTHEAADAPKRP